MSKLSFAVAHSGPQSAAAWVPSGLVERLALSSMAHDRNNEDDEHYGDAIRAASSGVDGSRTTTNSERPPVCLSKLFNDL